MSDELDRLLAIQELDTAADVLHHRRENLPERAELDSRQAALAALEAESAPVRERRHEVARAQQAIEDEMALLAEKTDAVNAALYGGTTSNPRELQALQDEVNALARRRATLEDRVLEQMLAAEPIDAELAAVAERRDALDEGAITAMGALAELESAIDAELADIEARRAPLVAATDADLLARYERSRARFKGVGVARFEGGHCRGCHLALPAAEAEQVRRQARDEGIATCPECDRLLVVI
jgi:predicted  nucleic acid-binding Zn-ribbon protein